MSVDKNKYYFVYETTNKVNGRKYVGVHTTYKIEDGYIGCGVYSQRKTIPEQTLKHAFPKAVKKHGVENFSRKILSFFDNYEDALQLEKLIVDTDWITSRKNYNSALGGGSVQIKSGRDNYQYKADVFQIDIKTKKVLGKFPNGNQAAISLDLSPTKINAVLRRVKKQYYGFFFTRDLENWENDYNNLLEESKVVKEIASENYSLKVTAYSPDGRIYKNFKSLKEAAEHFDVRETRTIKQNIDYNKNSTHRKLLWGHTWRYTNEDKQKK